MLDLERQLTRYGAAIESHLLEESPPPVTTAPKGWRPRRVCGVAAAAALAAAACLALLSIRPEGPAVSVDAVGSASTEPSMAGVFSVPTDAVLLFSDGNDGVTAIDLDNRLAGRRRIEGERAGDPPFRLAVIDDHLIVGWGQIFAAPLDGGPSEKIADATIYLPAAENSEVWTLTWAGGRIGTGGTIVRRVRLDGTAVFETDHFDSAILHPLVGVPGGLLVDSPEGVAVWDAATETIGSVLGPGPATATTASGRFVAWCVQSCKQVHTAALTDVDDPAPVRRTDGGRPIALSPTGSTLAVLRPDGENVELLLSTTSAPDDTLVVASDLDPTGSLVWSPDGEQLFYTDLSDSLLRGPTRIGLYDTRSGSWELATVPVGAGTWAVPLTRSEATTFFASEAGSADDCHPGGDASAVGLDGGCVFAFFTPDRPDDCVPNGERALEVPDAVGMRLDQARIMMQQAGLRVVDEGASAAERPVGLDEVVRAQEPPAGVSVPVGACVGFRTDE